MTLRYRGRFEIYAEMLLQTMTPKRKTRIMGLCGLAASQVVKYLETLKSGGLVEQQQDGSYIITKKGQQYIHTYDELMKLIGEAQVV